MVQSTVEKLREIVSQQRWDHGVALLQRLGPSKAAEMITAISFDEQEALFRKLPLDFAASLVCHFPYYHAFVLLHARPLQEMSAIVNKISPGERMEFFDELPEEAWQQLMDELSGKQTGEPTPGVMPSARLDTAGARAVPAVALTPILQARHIEKRFQQPDGREVQVIAPMDLTVEPDSIIALL